MIRENDTIEGGNTGTIPIEKEKEALYTDGISGKGLFQIEMFHSHKFVLYFHLLLYKYDSIPFLLLFDLFQQNILHLQKWK